MTQKTHERNLCASWSTSTSSPADRAVATLIALSSWAGIALLVRCFLGRAGGRSSNWSIGTARRKGHMG